MNTLLRASLGHAVQQKKRLCNPQVGCSESFSSQGSPVFRRMASFADTGSALPHDAEAPSGSFRAPGPGNFSSPQQRRPTSRQNMFVLVCFSVEIRNL